MSISGTLHVPHKEAQKEAHRQDQTPEAKPRPEHKNPATEEKRVDESVKESFPASDASAEVQPKPIKRSGK